MGGGSKSAGFFEGPQKVATPDALNAWMRRAAAGEEFVYCEAPSPIRDETWLRAGELSRDGYVLTLSRRRAGGGYVYFARRTGKAIARAIDPVEAALAEAATDIIFRALKRAANFELPCPSDAELARRAGLTIRQQAQQRVRKLIDLGLVESTLAYEGGVPSRVVRICAGAHAGSAAGKSTALPKKWAALQRAAERDARVAGGAK
jgi:hypothetical protein